MEKWLQAALGYVPLWLGHQIRMAQHPGAVLAVAHKGKPVFEQAFGRRISRRARSSRPATASGSPPIPRASPLPAY